MLGSSYIWIIITICIISLEWILFNKVLFSTSKSKVSIDKVNIVLFAVVLFFIFINLVNLFPNYRVLLCIFISVYYCKYIYCETIIKSLTISLVYWMVLLGIDAVSMSLIVWINSIDSMSALMELNIYRLQAIILSKSILLVSVFLYCKSKVNLDISKKDVIYILIPIIANIVSFLEIYKYLVYENNISILNNIEILTMSILLLLSNLSLVFSIQKIIDDNKLISEGKLIKEKMKMQYDHYINIQKDHMKIRQLHHDIKNHIICIKGVTLSSNEATDYINSIENELDRYNNSFNTQNMVLDIILKEKSKFCNKTNIKLLIDINNFDKCSFIETIDICSIFSNILDNAIDACEKMIDDKKEIILRGTIVNNFFVIRIENTKQNKINIENNFIKTSKRDKYLHGLGIRSVKDSVFKYGGDVVIDHSENRFIMKIFIPLVPR